MKLNHWLTLVAFLICLYIFWQIRSVLLLTFAAVVFAVVLNRAVLFLQKWKIARKGAVAITLVALLLVLGVVGVIIVPPFARQLQDLINLTPQVISRVEEWLQETKAVGPISLESIEGIASLTDRLRNFDLQMVINRFVLLFSNTLSITLNLLLLIVITIMMLLNPTPYRQLFIKIFPSSVRQQVKAVLDQCEDAIAGWFIGISFNMVVISLLSMVGLWILGVPLVLANGLLAGLLAFIPNIGPVVSIIPPVAIALLEAPWKAIAVVVLYVVIQQLESNVLTPFVMKQQVSLLPAITLLSQVVFAIFFGFLGLLLALPLTLTLQQWLDEFWVRRYAENH